MSEKCFVTSKTRSDFIYEHLKEDIVNLYYKPGERLSESKIAERYGVSRDSTRKGITRLVQEGLLISRPQYGTIVCELSTKQGKDVCDIRLLLETYAIRLAVKKLEASITAELMEEHERLWKKLDDDGPETVRAIYDLDAKMHNAVYSACGNAMVPQIIKLYSPIIRRIQVANMMGHNERRRETMFEMGKIITALANRDEKAAEAAMYVHINNIKQTMEKANGQKEDNTL